MAQSSTRRQQETGDDFIAAVYLINLNSGTMKPITRHSLALQTDTLTPTRTQILHFAELTVENPSLLLLSCNNGTPGTPRSRAYNELYSKVTSSRHRLEPDDELRTAPLRRTRTRPSEYNITNKHLQCHLTDSHSCDQSFPYAYAVATLKQAKHVPRQRSRVIPLIATLCSHSHFIIVR